MPGTEQSAPRFTIPVGFVVSQLADATEFRVHRDGRTTGWVKYPVTGVQRDYINQVAAEFDVVLTSTGPTVRPPQDGEVDRVSYEGLQAHDH